MRFMIVLYATCLTITVFGQQKYNCEFHETASLKLSDSILQVLQQKIQEKGIPASFAEQMIGQISSQEVLVTFRRIVHAGPDSTIILLKQEESEENPYRINMRDKKLLFYKSMVFEYDSLSKQFNLADSNILPKRFKETSDRKVIMGYSCTAFTGIDSSTIIWVASQLPSYINPGVHTGGVKGAVLAFETKDKSGNTVISMIDKFTPDD
ncbi:MAG: hypothetical protein JNN00_04385 [Chitinophagaceae bacterium]|nr:hypothetical protein [Chitinophagaceae bacterium]